MSEFCCEMNTSSPVADTDSAIAATKLAAPDPDATSGRDGTLDSRVISASKDSACYVSDGDDSDGGGSSAQGDIQLGFIDQSVNQLFQDPDWRNWDGGKVGGQPIWLNPTAIPHPNQLRCKYCELPMAFLLQMYCPLDDEISAFHRALYLFCCRRKKCMDLGSVKCFRSQLPRENPFYAYEPADGTSPGGPLAIVSSQFCQVCGCAAPHLCSRCKKVRYCSKEHQREHWKYHKSFECLSSEEETAKSATSISTESEKEAKKICMFQKLLFPEHSVAVEDEELDDEEMELAKSKPIMDRAHIWDDAVTPGGADEAEDAKLRQADYQKAAGTAPQDPRYLKFLTRISRGSTDQVLRYCRAPNVARVGTKDHATANKGLLLLSDDQSVARERQPDQLPACSSCGSPRAFECQIMPQLLHYLRVDRNTRLADAVKGDVKSELHERTEKSTTPIDAAFVNSTDKDIDWGSLDVFTCSRSCGLSAKQLVDVDASARSTTSHMPVLVEELVLRQGPVNGERGSAKY